MPSSCGAEIETVPAYRAFAGVDDLHAGLRRTLTAAGLPHDDRPFTPHLTVAYTNSPEVRAALRDHAGATWTAEEFVLVHSLHDQGGGYRRIRAWTLRAH